MKTKIDLQAQILILSKNVREQKDAQSHNKTIYSLPFLMEIKIAACRSIFVSKVKFCGAKSFLFLGFRLVCLLSRETVCLSSKIGFFLNLLLLGDVRGAGARAAHIK